MNAYCVVELTTAHLFVCDLRTIFLALRKCRQLVALTLVLRAISSIRDPRTFC